MVDMNLNKSGFKNNNCINLFFAFQKGLLRKSDFYLTEFGYTPEFKAGVHSGKLMVAEVGTVKKELAFHGDVINSASRIQSLCNDYNASLLVSKTILDHVNRDVINSEEIKEDFILKGKQEKLKVYRVTTK